MTQAYFKGTHENVGFGCAAKHFPGGIDERDQHLSPSVNSADCDTWMATYGKVYKGLIDCGLEAVMAGHIMQPAWTRKINPSIKDEDIMPATLSPELLQGLLRKELGFNGMILTDASHMVGLTCMMKRCDVLPRAIAAGCDMFLFFNDMDEDFGYMPPVRICGARTFGICSTLRRMPVMRAAAKAGTTKVWSLMTARSRKTRSSFTRHTGPQSPWCMCAVPALWTVRRVSAT